MVDTRPIPLPKDPAFWVARYRRVSDPNDPLQYERCGVVHESVFLCLEYWEELRINHLLDPMHIEGNVARSLVHHMFGSAKAHGDWEAGCMEQGRHADIWPQSNRRGEVVRRFQPTWVLTPAERKEFRRRVSTMKFPTNYGASLRGAFGDEKNSWPAFLKTHDYHRLIHDILPVAIIGLGSSTLQDAIWSLGKLMRWVCSKEITIAEIEAMKIESAEVICKLEIALPPSFFDGQIHLLIHLVHEVAIAGPVHPRWMYWVERCMGYMKSLVHTRARVEGSISERYLAAESMFYCSNILTTIDPSCQTGWMKEADPIEDDRLTGARRERLMTSLEVEQFSAFILSNDDDMDHWREHYEVEKQRSRRPLQFPKFWAYMKAKVKEVDDLEVAGESISHLPLVNAHVKTLITGPLLMITTRTAMWSKGRHF